MIAITSFATLFISAGVLLAGNGLFGTLLAVRANLEGFSPVIIGLLGSCFYAGFMAGSMMIPGLLRRTGHTRLFASLAAIYAVAALLHAMAAEPVFWILLRIFGGFCFAGLSLIVETWINARTPNEDRGRVLSVYRLVDLTCVTFGQFILSLMDPRSFEIFSVVAIFFCFCLVPLSVSNQSAPATAGSSTRIRILRLFYLSPLGFLGVFGVGLVNGTFRTMAPTVAANLGFDLATIVLMINCFIIGGAVFQYPVGIISDRIDRRHVLMVMTTGAMISSAMMVFTVQWGIYWFLASSFLFGGFAVPIYSLAVSHTNDFAKPGEFVEVSAGLFLVFAVGATIGPFLGSAAILMGGDRALFLYTCGMHAILLVFAIIRSRARRTVPFDQRRKYFALLRTSTALFNIDPRSRQQGRHVERKKHEHQDQK